jgi:hypothetical protein
MRLFQFVVGPLHLCIITDIVPRYNYNTMEVARDNDALFDFPYVMVPMTIDRG